MAAQTLGEYTLAKIWLCLCKLSVFVLLPLVVFAPVDSSAGSETAIVVDINPDNGRSDVLTRSAANWPFDSEKPATLSLNSFEASISALGSPDAKATSGWWKAGYDYPANLCSDGVTTVEKGQSLRLSLRELPAGKYGLVTWHNSWDAVKDQSNSEDSLWVRLSIVGDSDSKAVLVSKKEVHPSRRVLHDDLAASAYFEFQLNEGEIVEVEIAPNSSGGFPILNGFALNLPDPMRTVRIASPANDDLHVPENPELKWQIPAIAEQLSQSIAVRNSPNEEGERQASSDPRPTGLQYHVYLGSDANRVALATQADSEYQGVTAQLSWPTEVSDHLVDYFWRVDCEMPDQSRVGGVVRRFRVRRLAFPGAEGYGRFAIGGRGGRVLFVTNLNDSGPGSLREAIEAEGNRTVLFQVGGTIELKSKLLIRNPFVTIAGQTAPGDGICVKGYTFGCFGTHDVIMRYVRLRVGDESSQTMDGTGFASTDHSIFDHCSISWSIDEAVSSRSAKNITLQRCIVAEALNVANHQKYESGKGHSFAGSISGDIGSFHHNLLVHCAGRNWSLAGGLDRGGRFAGRLDIRNNVVYNWEHRTNDGGVKALNLVNNLYIPGPATRVFHLLKPDAGSPEDRQQYYVSGNRMEGLHDENEDNWNKAVITDPRVKKLIRLEAPFCEPFVTTHEVAELLEEVLSDVGANLTGLDAVDQRVLRDVRNRSTTAKGSKTGLPGIIDSQVDVGGWPQLQSGASPQDSDLDGLPDQWEIEHGLDPKTQDQNRQLEAGADTALEIYLAQLVHKSN